MTSLYEYSKSRPVVIAGPCVMESPGLLDEVASVLHDIKNRKGYRIVFKSSFDKANRTSVHSFRGPGLEKGLTWLQDIKSRYQLEVTTDIHESYQAGPAGQVVDVLQIPAFLCRQTDLVVAAAQTGRVVNIKKAQFLTAEDMKYPLEKAKSTGNEQVWLTERGNIMGYNNLVVDFRNIPAMKLHGVPVIMDCTHAVQQPGGGVTGGNRALVKPMALAAKAFGADGYFFEVHPDPPKGLSDAANMYYLDRFEDLLDELIAR